MVPLVLRVENHSNGLYNCFPTLLYNPIPLLILHLPSLQRVQEKKKFALLRVSRDFGVGGELDGLFFLRWISQIRVLNELLASQVEFHVKQFAVLRTRIK